MGVRIAADNLIDLNLKMVGEIDSKNVNKINDQDNHVFILCKRGKINFLINNKKVTIEKNQIIHLGVEDHYQIISGEYFLIYFICNGSLIDELIRKSLFNNKVNIVLDNDCYLAKYFNRLLESYNEVGYNSLKCLGIVYEFFYEITKQSEYFDDPPILNKKLEQAQEYILENFNKEILVSDVAKKVGFTVNYFSTQFSKKMNISPKAYINKLRMEQAKKLIASGKYKIKEVAKNVGFSNPLYFSGEFKKYTGYSPTDYIEHIYLLKNKKLYWYFFIDMLL